MLNDFHFYFCPLTEEIRLFQSVSEEKNNYQEEINFTLQGRVGNIDWFKCGCECKLIVTFTECFCLLLRLKSREAREHFAVHPLWATDRLLVTHFSLMYLVNELSFLFLVLIKGMTDGGECKISLCNLRGLGASPVFSLARWCNLVHVKCLQMIKPMVVGVCSVGG